MNTPSSTPFVGGPPPSRPARPTIPVVVAQHVEGAAHLRQVRSVLVRAPRVRLRDLARHDERIAAHLDGVAIAGDAGSALVEQSLARPGRGELFTATVRAIEERDADRFERLLAVAEAIPGRQPDLLSAFGWVSASHLRGITKALMESSRPWRREVGLVACAMHGVDPGRALAAAASDDDAALRARALRVAGQVGRCDLIEACLARLGDDDEQCGLEAARSAALLGERTASLAALEAMVQDRGPDSANSVLALRTLLMAVAPRRARAILASLVKAAGSPRTVIDGVATAGDPQFAPWLIAQMEVARLARLAGEALSLMVGIDLTALGLERTAPDAAAQPGDDVEDGCTGEDDGLPWPDAAKVATWWQANGSRFVPGERYFMGEPPTPAKSVEVLRRGFQRQRMAAAQWLTLLSPGTPLFNVAAPAWRQQGLLAKITEAKTT